MEVYAWVSTVVCLLISVRLAHVFLSRNMRYFTIMALFSACWAVLIPYYGEFARRIPQSELFPALQGFLLIYVGALVHQEADHEQKSEKTIGLLARTAMWLLPALVAPQIAMLPVPPSNTPLIDIPQDVAESLVTATLCSVGYVSLYLGVKRLFRNTLRSNAMLAIAIIYSSLEFGHFFQIATTAKAPMYPFLAFGFSTMKLILTLCFGLWVTHRGMDEEVRNSSLTDKLVMFVGI